MSVRHRLEYGALVGLAALLRALPRAVALELGAAIGALGWALGIRRSLVLANLRQALPEASERERRRIAARAARNFGRTVAEFVRFAGRDRARVADLVAVEGAQPLRAAGAAGTGAIVVSAHLGSWALYVTALAATGIPSALLVGRQHNEKVDAFILGIPGDAVRFISKGASSPRGVLQCLREARAVVIVADQHVSARGDPAPFLGRVAATLPLPAAVAIRHGTPTFVMTGVRVAHGRHVVTIRPVEAPAAGDEDERRHQLTVRLNEALGEAIRANPDQYFWYHRRWR